MRHLKHIGPLGLAFLTSMFKTALNNNIIPHIWKLVDIVLNPSKDIDYGISYRPISLLSVITKTLEKSLLPHITATLSNTIPPPPAKPTQHTETTPPYNVKLKLAFLKVASSHTHCSHLHCRLPPTRAPIQIMAYADDITITSTFKINVYTSISDGLL